MNKLWAPWRMDYIRTPKEDGCIFAPNINPKKIKKIYCFLGERIICFDEFISVHKWTFNDIAL